MAEELILVVDDGQENREFIVENILTPNGYRSLSARDGKEALELASRDRPDLILLDYQMPRMNGIDMLRIMHANNLNIPVILMTFYGSEEVAVEVYRLGVRDYIKKPFTVDEMLMAIERSLGEVRIRKEKEALTERLLHANRELQTRLQELNVLYSIGKSVTSLMERSQLLTRVVDAAVKVTNAEEGFLYLIEDGGKVVCRAQKRQRAARAENVAVEVNDPAARRVIETGQPLLLGPDQIPPGVKAAWLTCAPLMVRNQVIGVLGARNLNATAAFSKHDTALISALTDYAAIALENARNVEALHLAQEDEKMRIRDTFQRFVPRPVVDQVLNNPEGVRLGGKRREVSIVFADLRGYTSYSENAPPEEVIEMLNGYLSLAANIMMSYGGTLDKYMGDGLMALFNAPNDQPDHVSMAVEAALMLQQASRHMSEQRSDGLAFSIGIHVGEAICGYIGTETAMNYTAVGDSVNLAKRLQEAAKPGQILVEQSVISRLGDQVQAISLGELKVKGRSKPSLVYDLQGVTERP